MSFLWRDKRVLIVFSRTADALATEQTETLLADRAALEERDMVILGVTGDRVEPIFGDVPLGVDASALRSRYGVEAGSPFTVLLIGKDGGVKWRENRPAKPAELFGLIDAMPMRRAEMREQHSGS